VCRVAHPSDRRLLVEITRRGLKAARAFRPVVHNRQKDWHEALSQQEQRQPLKIHHRLQASLEAEGE